MKMSKKNDHNDKESEKTFLDDFLYPDLCKKFYSVLHPILHPSFVEIHIVVFV